MGLLILREVLTGSPSFGRGFCSPEAREATPDMTAHERHAEIIRRLRSQEPVKSIAQAVGLTVSRVYVIAKSHSIPLPPKPKVAHPRRPDPRFDGALVELLAEHPDWTDHQLAEALACSRTKIWKHRKDLGHQIAPGRPNYPMTNKREAAIRELLESGVRHLEIAAEVHCSLATISKVVKKFGLVRRGSHSPRSIRLHGPDE
jgi:transposase